MNSEDRAAFEQTYRRTIGRFATGVTVLLAERDGVVRGMTANAVTSLSLDPTLLIVCPSKRSRFGGLLAEGTSFTVNILGDDQEGVSSAFAHTDSDDLRADPPAPLTVWTEAGTAPRLDACIAALGCRVHQLHDGGDHWIVVGEVVALHTPGEEPWPLLFFEGAYHHPSRMAGNKIERETDPYA